MSLPDFDSRSFAQSGQQPAVQSAAVGRIDPTAWDGTEDTDPAMVIDVERGALVEDVPAEGWLS